MRIVCGFVAIVMFVLAQPSAAAVDREVDAIASFLDIASNLPLVRDVADLVIAKQYHSNAVRSAPPAVLQQCVSQAQNNSLFNQDCFGVLSQLEGLDGAFSLGSSRSTPINATVIASVCKSRCFQKFNLFFKAWGQCLKANGAMPQTSTAGTPVNPRSVNEEKTVDNQNENLETIRAKAWTRGLGGSMNANIPDFDSGMTAMANLIGNVMKMFCLRNENGQYCMAQISSLSSTLTSALSGGIGGGFSSSSSSVSFPTSATPAPSTQLTPDSPTCVAIKGVGCCFGSFMSMAVQIMADTASQTGTPVASMQQMQGAINQVVQQVKTSCQLTGPQSCDVNPGQAAKMNGAAKLSLLWNWWNQQSAARQEQIKTAFCTDLAAAGGFYADLCTVTSVAPATTSSRRLLQSNGGTSFNYQVEGLSSASLQASKAALDGSVNFQDVGQVAGTSVTGTSTVQDIIAAPGEPASSGSSLTANVLMVVVAAVMSMLFF